MELRAARLLQQTSALFLRLKKLADRPLIREIGCTFALCANIHSTYRFSCPSAKSPDQEGSRLVCLKSATCTAFMLVEAQQPQFCADVPADVPRRHF